MEKATYQDGTTLKDNVSKKPTEKVIKVFEIVIISPRNNLLYLSLGV